LKQTRKKTDMLHQRDLKRNEVWMRKRNLEIEMLTKKTEVAHQKALNQQLIEEKKIDKELEKQTRLNKIDSEKRGAILEEYNAAKNDYMKELELAKEAMQAHIRSGGKANMQHEPPKINWGPPAGVVAGRVNWQIVR